MKKYRILAGFLFLALLFTFPAATFAAEFEDAKEHWSEKYIDWATDENLVKGYEDGTFRPDGKITRAEFYTMVNRLAKLEKTDEVYFTDVRESDWFYDEVAKGVSYGYLMNRKEKLEPDQPMDRDEAARIVALIYDLPSRPEYADRFTDRDKLYNKGAVGALVKEGILNGYPDGSFKPEGTITRGEFSKIVFTSVKNIGYPAEVNSSKQQTATVGELETAVKEVKTKLKDETLTDAERKTLESALNAAEKILDMEKDLEKKESKISKSAKEIEGILKRLKEAEAAVDNQEVTSDNIVKVSIYDTFDGRDKLVDYAYVIKGNRLDMDQVYYPRRKYYSFDGLSFTRTGSTIELKDIRFSKDTDLYIRWKVLEEFKDLIDNPDGTINVFFYFFDREKPYASFKINKGEKIPYSEVKDPSRDGAIFKGWANLYDQDKKVIDLKNQTFNKGTKLVPVWENPDDLKEYCLYLFDDTGSHYFKTAWQRENQIMKFPQDIHLNRKIPVGWTTKPNGQGEKVDPDKPLNRDMNLYGIMKPGYVAEFSDDFDRYDIDYSRPRILKDEPRKILYLPGETVQFRFDKFYSSDDKDLIFTGFSVENEGTDVKFNDEDRTFQFTMPARDIKIEPIYEPVKEPTKISIGGKEFENTDRLRLVFTPEDLSTKQNALDNLPSEIVLEFEDGSEETLNLDWNRFLQHLDFPIDDSLLIGLKNFFPRYISERYQLRNFDIWIDTINN